MRRVRCVSPHGGAHNGLRADNDLPAPPGYSGALKLAPNEGGWVFNPVLGHVAVGDEMDAPEPPEFIADGFHFVNEDGTADVCQASGDGCWCGRHRDVQAEEAPAPPPAAPEASASGPGTLADLFRKGDS
jgi:hypothetical protein